MLLLVIGLPSLFCVFFRSGELVLHIFKKATESVLGKTVIFLLTVPDVERSLDDALADAGRYFPWVLEFFEFLEGKGVDVFAIFIVC